MWKVKNNGNVQWPAGSRLLFNGGNIFKPYPMSYPEGFTLPALAPNEEACITAELQAPDAPGNYTSYFCFATPDGVRFGDELWCDIKVAEDFVDQTNNHDMIYPTISTTHEHHDDHSTATSTDRTTFDDHLESHGSSPVISELHFSSEEFVDDHTHSKHSSGEDEYEVESVASQESYLVVETEQHEENEQVSNSYESIMTIKKEDDALNTEFKYKDELQRIREMVIQSWQTKKNFLN